MSDMISEVPESQFSSSKAISKKSVISEITELSEKTSVKSKEKS